jgi:hypothetical protein
LKAATITPERHGDVGSPNRILREEIGGRVIVRTGRRIPGVVPLGGVHAPISIVRMAVGDAYGAHEWREGAGDDEAAFRTERIERRICHAVAEFAFRQAARTSAKVFGGPKYTVSPIYEGMRERRVDQLRLVRDVRMPRRRRVHLLLALARRFGGLAASGPRDPGGVPRSGRAGRAHGRPARPCDDDRVHRRGDRPDQDEARGLGNALVSQQVNTASDTESGL